MSVTDVVFLADRLFEPGLHVALHSFAKNSEIADSAATHLFLARYDASSRQRLEETFRSASGSANFLNLHDTSELRTIDAKGLHGASIPLLSLSLPSFFGEGRQVLLIDSDMVVRQSLAELHGNHNAPASACAEGPVCGTLPNEFDLMIEAGIDPKRLYFNTGFVLFNTTVWNGLGLDEAVASAAHQYGKRLVTADQSLFNLVVGDHCSELPQSYNFPAGFRFDPNKPEAVAAIVWHHLGSPKPFDPLGGVLHPAGPEFKRLLRLTAYQASPSAWFARSVRTARLARSYSRACGHRWRRASGQHRRRD